MADQKLKLSKFLQKLVSEGFRIADYKFDWIIKIQNGGFYIAAGPKIKKLSKFIFLVFDWISHFGFKKFDSKFIINYPKKP